MVKKISFVLLGILMTAGLFAHDLQGRDVVEKGRYTVLSGTLRVDEDELYIDTDKGIYLMHLGPEWYAEEIHFPRTTGKAAKVEGFVVDGDISPTTIAVDSVTYSFRDNTGRPGWAGRGNRDNRRVDS
jgi:hypothetical protein